MLKNYFIVAWRNLRRNKFFSLINISGLTIGMAAAILILLWLENEITFDRFHEKGDRIYQAWNRAVFSNKLQCWNSTPKVLAQAVQKDLPEVEKVCRVNWTSDYLMSVGDKRLSATGNAVDSTFLQLFTFPLIQGDPVTALNDPASIVITENLAHKLFGSENAMGKVIRLDNQVNYKVSAIAKDPPNNTRFNFEYLLPWAEVKRLSNDASWGNNSVITYVMLKENASVESAQGKLKNIRKRYSKEDADGEIFLYPQNRVHLYGRFEEGIEKGGKIEYVRMFAVIAGFILLIACINFMNLSTARSERRAREVGIRKAVGAQKGALIRQFISESVLLALISMTCAVLIVQFTLPAYSTLTGKKLFLDYGSFYFWGCALLFTFFTGLLAGSYPAFFLSSFKPARVLKGTLQAGKTMIAPRKVLVVVQFSFAIILIISTIIVKQQINYAQQRENGYDKDHLAYHYLTDDIKKNYSLIRNELTGSGVASFVCRTSSPITQGWSDSWGFQWAGKDPNDKTDFDRYAVDEMFVKTAGLKLKAGRDFDLNNYPTDSSAIILNESAVKAMGFKEPIGQIIKDDELDWHVIGVIEDFILRSPFQPTRPMVIEGIRSKFINTVTIKFAPGNIQEHLQKTETVFRKYNPAYPFQIHFIDEEYAQKFENEKRTATLAGLFAGLTIFISCLGLFGLATYTAENRIKEIGVRKVLGASVMNIVTLLSKDFLTLVIISFLLATPLAWWFMYKWLKDYPYHITIGWWVFMLAGSMAVTISLLTVSYQSVRAALANPVKSLRTE